jgi:mutator protein MutT
MKPGIDYIGVGVGACIENTDGKILLALRGMNAKNERGKWEIPGGAVEFGETFEEALTREVYEELGIRITIGQVLEIVSHILKDEKQHWVSPTYLCSIAEGVPKIREPDKCERIGWFTLEEAKNLPLSVLTTHDVSTLEKRRMNFQKNSV